MSVKCPKCSHIRTPEEDEVVPKWKCPQCDIVYSKFNNKIKNKDVTCPKCNHIRTPEEDEVVPKWKCPKCNVIYSKFNSPVKKKLVSSYTQKKHHQSFSLKIMSFFKKKNKNTYLVYFIVLLSFVMGYFLGREHIKYEMRQVLTNAANKLENNLKEIFEPGKEDYVSIKGDIGETLESSDKDNSIPKESKKVDGVTLEVSLIKKGYRDFNLEIGNKAVTFTLVFRNTLDKRLRAFNGLLVFNDLLDNPIKQLKLSCMKPVGSNKSITWDGEMNFNQFIHSDRLLRSKDVSDLKVKFILEKALYSDGTTENF